MHSNKTRDLCFIGVFVAMIIGVSQIPPIPLPGGVPITLQTFIIPLAGAVLGAKKGAIAAFIFILLGAIGLPVFHGFSGGIGHILGPTGGFIFSFPLMAFVVGFGADRWHKIWLALGLIVGVVVNLGLGMLWFSFVMEVSLQAAFFAAVAPFVIIELGKMVGVFVVSLSLREVLKRGRVLGNF